MAAGLGACVALHFLWKAAGFRSPWPRRFLGFAGRRAGLRVRIEGEPLAGHVLFVSNHVTWLDILALGGATGTAFVSRDDVEHWPLVGWIAGLNDTIYVARHARREVHGQADRLRQALASGRAVSLFPEGTTEGGHAVLPFRPSLFASLYPPLPGVRVQPVAIDYGAAAEEIAWVGAEPAGANAGRILSRAGTIPVVLRFLPPVDPEAAGERKALAAAARAEIVEALYRA
ncbi:lysophospholipid acyltransferase family protein [Sphingosinicella terrae]|uniref:lysophospholipid acyltransferase family protein n=1 Tax=Sphingosinicella terrae TaxID=2172047 RepID=UPI000E0D8422|nr:lysophospholipid acyltransferase family protein [Sphingosinicella terrae]